MKNSQTVKNMKLVALEMSRQSSYSSIEVLSDSYSALLSHLECKKVIEKGDVAELEEQKESLADLLRCLEEESIPSLLSDGAYQDVNHIVTTITNLSESIDNLNDFLLRTVYPMFRRHVGVVATDFDTAQNKINKILSDSGEEVLEHQILHNGKMTVYTKTTLYEAIKYSDSYRGKIIDTVYIDRNLPTKSINIANMYVRDKDGAEICYFN